MDNTLLYDRQTPILSSGKYTIEIAQQLMVGGYTLNGINGGLSFVVASENYLLNPQDIDSVYPAPSARSDFSSVFAHIVLNRPGFPWTRQAEKGNKYAPWLALIIFSEDELETKERAGISVKHVSRAKWEMNPQPSDFTEEIDAKQELITIITGSSSMLGKCLPSLPELTMLAHMQKTADDEKSVIICNRLPIPGKRNYVHLLSMENHYSGGQLIDKPTIAFASLKSWDFFCTDHYLILDDLIKPSLDKLGMDRPEFVGEFRDHLNAAKGKEFFSTEEFWQYIKFSPTLMQRRMAQVVLSNFRIDYFTSIVKQLTIANVKFDKSTTDSPAAHGFSPVPYILKTGKRMDAAYRGPLQFFDIQENNDVVLTNADQALSLLPSFKQLNISYAAAWQIGRLTALKDKELVTAICQWKRKCYRILRANDSLSDQTCPVPTIILSYFKDLYSTLRQIPFNYLFPDNSLLSTETMSLLKVDTNWLQHFADGVLSIGRSTDREKEYDRELYVGFVFLTRRMMAKNVLLIHSRLISDWPEIGMEVKNGNNLLTPLIKEKILPSLLFASFDSSVSSVSFFQKPEHVHFGTDDVKSFTSIENYLTGKDSRNNPERNSAEFAYERWQSGTIITMSFQEVVSAGPTH